jgi:hypothetical protein
MEAKSNGHTAGAWSTGRKHTGNSGRYLSVLNWLSEYGLSFETWG